MRQMKKSVSEGKTVAPKTKMMIAIINKHVAKIILASIWKFNSMGFCN